MIVKDASRVIYGATNTPRPGGSRAKVITPNTKPTVAAKPRPQAQARVGFTGSEPKRGAYEPRPPRESAWAAPYPGAINSYPTSGELRRPSPARPMLPPAPGMQPMQREGIQSMMPPAPGFDLGGMLKKVLQPPPWVRYFGQPDIFQPLVPRNEWTETGGKVGVQGIDILNGLRAFKDLLAKYGQ